MFINESKKVIINNIIEIIRNFNNEDENEVSLIYNEIHLFNRLYKVLEPEYNLPKLNNIESLKDVKELLIANTVGYIDKLMKYTKLGGTDNPKIFDLLNNSYESENIRAMNINEYLNSISLILFNTQM